jgi:hypothetical protein
MATTPGSSSRPTWVRDAASGSASASGLAKVAGSGPGSSYAPSGGSFRTRAPHTITVATDHGTDSVSAVSTATAGTATDEMAVSEAAVFADAVANTYNAGDAGLKSPVAPPPKPSKPGGSSGKPAKPSKPAQGGLLSPTASSAPSNDFITSTGASVSSPASPISPTGPASGPATDNTSDSNSISSPVSPAPAHQATTPKPRPTGSRRPKPMRAAASFEDTVVDSMKQRYEFCAESRC